MATIKAGRKAEVLTSLTVSEYEASLRFDHSLTDSTNRVEIEIPDPARKERDMLRSWVESCRHYDEENSLVPDTTLDALLARLDERDAASVYSYGDQKGEPRPFNVSLYLDCDVSEAIRGVLSGEAVSYANSTTIRKALVGTTDF